MNASNRLISSTICHPQLSSLKIPNPLARRVGIIPQCNSSSIHTNSQRCSQDLKRGSDSLYGRTKQRSHAGPFSINVRQQKSMRNESIQAFLTRYTRSKGGVVAVRLLHSSSARDHGDIKRPAPSTGITVHFRDSSNHLLKTIEGNEGDSLLELAHEHDIDMEGACEGSVACSTCHVILTPEHYDLLEEPEDDENDMLDMAFGLTDTSRLGCQVKLKKELNGMTVTLPSATRNFFVDGAKPTKH